MVKICRAQSGQEKSQGSARSRNGCPSAQPQSFCYPVSSQGSETFSQVNRLVHQISIKACMKSLSELTTFLFPRCQQCQFFFRAQDLETKKQHIPLVDRTPLEPPPIMVAIVGPPKVGKTTLLQALIKNFTRQNITSIQGPVTIVTGNALSVNFYNIESKTYYFS
jgi:hypothetical protein